MINREGYVLVTWPKTSGIVDAEFFELCIFEPEVEGEQAPAYWVPEEFAQQLQ